MRLGKLAGLAACTTVMLLASPIAEGQTADARDYDMPAQDLGTALRQVAAQSGRPVIMATDLVAGLTASALKGRFSSDMAVDQLLRGTGLRAVRVGTTLVVERVSDGGDPEGASGDVLVTGTRIRGKTPVGSRAVRPSCQTLVGYPSPSSRTARSRTHRRDATEGQAIDHRRKDGSGY